MADILDPSLEATQLTEGEITVTISFALPSVLSLITQLQDMVDKQNEVLQCTVQRPTEVTSYPVLWNAEA